MHKCYKCGTTKDLRPYGKDGAPVCFDCGTSTEEDQNIALEQFEKVLSKNVVYIPMDMNKPALSYEESIIITDSLEEIFPDFYKHEN